MLDPGLIQHRTRFNHHRFTVELINGLRDHTTEYSITQWLPGGSTFNGRWKGRATQREDRWEFVGTIATPAIRDRYINRYVGHLFTQGAQNPIAYVNIE